MSIASGARESVISYYHLADQEGRGTISSVERKADQFPLNVEGKGVGKFPARKRSVFIFGTAAVFCEKGARKLFEDIAHTVGVLLEVF